MAVVGTAEIEIVPNTRNFAAKAEADTAAQADGLGKKLGIAIGLAAVGAGAFDFAKTSVEAFSQEQQGILKLDSALANNQATVGLTAKAFDGLNQKLMEHSTFNAEASQTVEGQLALYHLTAAQIQQLTPLVEDYAARTGKDVTTAAKLAGAAILGKGRALKDVGIAFQDLKDPTKNYTELVGGLRQQVGGFAEKEGSTFQGRMQILKNEFHEVQVEVGERLVPILTRFLGVIVNDVVPAIESVVGWLSQHRTVAIALGVAVGGVLVAATVAWAVSLFAAGGALAFLLSPITLIVAAVALLAVGVVWAYQHVQVFHDVVNAIATYFTTSFVPQMQAVGAVVVDVWNHIYTVGKAVFDAIAVVVNLFIVGPIKFLADQIGVFVVWWQAHWDEIRAVFVFVFEAIRLYVVVWWDILSSVFRVAMDVILPIVQVAWQILQAMFHTTFDLVAGVVRGAWDFIAGVFATTRDTILGIVGVLLDVLTGKWGRAWEDIKSTVTNVLGDVSGTIGRILGDIVGTIGRLAGDVFDAAKGIGTSLVNGITTGIASLFGDIATAIHNVIQSAIDHLPGPLKAIVGTVIGWFAEGGFVPGPVGQPQLAVVHGGEFVLSNDMLRGARAAPVATAGAGVGVGGRAAVSVTFEQHFYGPTMPDDLRRAVVDVVDGELGQVVDRALAGVGRHA